MKVFAGPLANEATTFTRLSMPSGRTLPRAPVPGELYNLEADMPLTNTVSKWYSRGTYVWDGYSWNKISIGKRQRRSAIIGAQDIELETADSAVEAPTPKAGVSLTQVVIAPSQLRTSVSGSASIWLDAKSSCRAWLTIFNGKRLVGLAAATVQPQRPACIFLTFTDIPNSIDPQTYTLRLHADAATKLFVNKSIVLGFDGAGATALIVEEDN